MFELTVVLPTYNPDIRRLNSTLNGLKTQTLSALAWELLLIDNNSTTNFSGEVDLSWHPNSACLYEPKQGLTFARLCGFQAARGRIIIMVDDDNVLGSDYLEKVLDIFGCHLLVGAIGGKSLPLFEASPPSWLAPFYGNLALRDMGEEIRTAGWENKYPDCAPIGAGMAVRTMAINGYIQKINSGGTAITDRTGNSLMSGGDNDMVLEILKSGWKVGYFPELQLQHIIPAQRMAVPYLARMLNNTNNSWVKLLRTHNINPWKPVPGWSIRIRKLKAWFTCKAWAGPVNYIKWRGACGTFDGLSK
jgi:glycosyltransferase involved in cell wall biosynthesis